MLLLIQITGLPTKITGFRGCEQVVLEMAINLCPSLLKWVYETLIQICYTQQHAAFNKIRNLVSFS